MIERGQNNLPTSKRHLMSRFQQSTTLRMQLIKELPRLAAALGLNDDDVELPEVLLDLLSNPQIEMVSDLPCQDALQGLCLNTGASS